MHTEVTEKTRAHQRRLIERYPSLGPLEQTITRAFTLLQETFASGNKLLVCGNGGSASDADHIVGELMKGFYKQRTLSEEQIAILGPESRMLQGALPAISLLHPASLLTAFANDVDPSMAFAQSLYGLAQKGDLFMGISTSGNSVNVVNAAKIAKALGLRSIALTGQGGGQLLDLCSCTINVPSTITAEVQELHLPIYHTLCAMVEEHFFP